MDSVFPGQDVNQPVTKQSSTPTNLILKPGVILRISTKKKSNTSDSGSNSNYITVRTDSNRVINVQEVKPENLSSITIDSPTPVTFPSTQSTSSKATNHADDKPTTIQCNILRRAIKLNSWAKTDHSLERKITPKLHRKCQSEECDHKKTKDDAPLQDTFIRKHVGKMKYPCATCGRNFKEKSQLEIHLRYHTEERPYKCLKCGKAYFTKGRLRSHHRLHLRDKRYKCMMCDKLFFNPSHLVRHSFVHAKDKPHQCEVCGRCFSQQSNLTRHLRVHTKEKPYQCTVCLKTFPRFDTLQRHQTIHFQKRYYKCSICQRLFHTADELTEHCAQHQKVNGDDSSDDFILQN